jgi:hypothetical protein
VDEVVRMLTTPAAVPPPVASNRAAE